MVLQNKSDNSTVHHALQSCQIRMVLQNFRIIFAFRENGKNRFRFNPIQFSLYTHAVPRFPGTFFPFWLLFSRLKDFYFELYICTLYSIAIIVLGTLNNTLYYITHITLFYFRPVLITLKRCCLKKSRPGGLSSTVQPFLGHNFPLHFNLPQVIS
jgi:hypothetical protein